MALGLLKRFQLWSRPGVARLWWLPSLRLTGEVPRSHIRWLPRWQADQGRHQRGHMHSGGLYPWRHGSITISLTASSRRFLHAPVLLCSVL